MTAPNPKADGARGWFKLSREFPAALAAMRLSAAASSVVYAIMARSYALPIPQRVSTLNRQDIGKLLGSYSADTVTDAIRGLISRGVIFLDGDNPRLSPFGINTRISEWEGLDLDTFEAIRAPFRHLAATVNAPESDESEPESVSQSHEESEKTPILSTPCPESHRRKLRSPSEKTPVPIGENSDTLTGLREEKRESPPLSGSPPEIKIAPTARKADSCTAQAREQQRPSVRQIHQEPDGNERWIIRAGIAALLLSGGFPEDEAIRGAAALANHQVETLGGLDGPSFADAIDGVCRYQADQEAKGGAGVRSVPGALVSAFDGRQEAVGPFKPRFRGVRWDAWLKSRERGDLPLPPRADLTPGELAEWRRDWKQAQFDRELAEAQRQRQATLDRELAAARARKATPEPEPEPDRVGPLTAALAPFPDPVILRALDAIGWPAEQIQLAQIQCRRWLGGGRTWPGGQLPNRLHDALEAALSHLAPAPV